MSQFTKGAIFRRLESDSLLASVLAADPHTNAGGRKAIFNAWKGKAPKALPQLLVIQADDSSTELIDQARGTSGIWDERWHFEAWAATTDDVHQTIIEAHVKRLLHNQRFGLDGGANLIWCNQIGGTPEGYDSDLKESFSIAIYAIRYVI